MSRPKYKSRIWISRTGYWWVDGKYWLKDLPDKYKSASALRFFDSKFKALKVFNALKENARLITNYTRRGKYHIKTEAEK